MDPKFLRNQRYAKKHNKSGLPPVTKWEYQLIAPYLGKLWIEDEENLDDSFYYPDDFDELEEWERMKNPHQVVKKFPKQVRESRGYNVTCSPPSAFGSPFIPLRLDKLDKEKSWMLWDKIVKTTKFAIDKINSDSNKPAGRTYEYVDVEQAVDAVCFLMLLTFKAKEVVDNADAKMIAPVKTFQAMMKEWELKEWRFKA